MYHLFEKNLCLIEKDHQKNQMSKPKFIKFIKRNGYHKSERHSKVKETILVKEIYLPLVFFNSQTFRNSTSFPHFITTTLLLSPSWNWNKAKMSARYFCAFCFHGGDGNFIQQVSFLFLDSNLTYMFFLYRTVAIPARHILNTMS